MRQQITSIHHNECGQAVITVTGGISRQLTACNMRIVRNLIPARSIDSIPRHHETGLLYSGTYPTTALVVGDDWDSVICPHTTTI